MARCAIFGASAFCCAVCRAVGMAIAVFEAATRGGRKRVRGAKGAKEQKRLKKSQETWMPGVSLMDTFAMY